MKTSNIIIRSVGLFINSIIHCFISFQYATGVNVIGMLPGTLTGSPNDRPFLIGSHYDTVRTTSHGANDNGSGVSAMLQVAKQITAGRGGATDHTTFKKKPSFHSNSIITGPGRCRLRQRKLQKIIINNWSQGKQLVLFSIESRSFPRRKSWATSQRRTSRTFTTVTLVTMRYRTIYNFSIVQLAQKPI